jgi:hypothetical protein
MPKIRAYHNIRSDGFEPIHPTKIHLGSGPIHFDEMAGKWQKYARKTAKDGLKPVRVV